MIYFAYLSSIWAGWLSSGPIVCYKKVKLSLDLSLKYQQFNGKKRPID